VTPCCIQVVARVSGQWSSVLWRRVVLRWLRVFRSSRLLCCDAMLSWGGCECFGAVIFCVMTLRCLKVAARVSEQSSSVLWLRVALRWLPEYRSSRLLCCDSVLSWGGCQRIGAVDFCVVTPCCLEVAASVSEQWTSVLWRRVVLRWLPAYWSSGLLCCISVLSWGGCQRIGAVDFCVVTPCYPEVAASVLEQWTSVLWRRVILKWLPAYWSSGLRCRDAVFSWGDCQSIGAVVFCVVTPCCLELAARISEQCSSVLWFRVVLRWLSAYRRSGFLCFDAVCLEVAASVLEQWTSVLWRRVILRWLPAYSRSGLLCCDAVWPWGGCQNIGGTSPHGVTFQKTATISAIGTSNLRSVDGVGWLINWLVTHYQNSYHTHLSMITSQFYTNAIIDIWYDLCVCISWINGLGDYHIVGVMEKVINWHFYRSLIR
jgi:hypothetical protein